MKVKNNILLFFIGMFLIILLDFIWIGLLMKNFYYINIGAFYRTAFLLLPALLVYALLSSGIVMFAISPDIKKTFMRGSLLGLIIYGVYDLTNYAILNFWGLELTFIDMLWGTVLCGAVSSLLWMLKNGTIHKE